MVAPYLKRHNQSLGESSLQNINNIFYLVVAIEVNLCYSELNKWRQVFISNSEKVAEYKGATE